MLARKSAVFLLAGLLAAFLAGCGESLTEEELLARASESLSSGNVTAAIVDAKTALQQNADNPKGRRLLGEALMQQGDLLGAAAEFERSLQSASDPEVAALLAEALLGSGQHARLVELQRQDGALDFAMENPVFLAHLSRAQLLNGDGFTAELTWEDAAALAPDRPEVMLAEAVLQARHKGDLDAAEQVLERLTGSAPGYPDGWSLYGNLHQVRGDRAAAETAFAEAVRLAPQRLEDRLSLVAMLVEQEKYEEAAEAMAPLEQRAPDHPGLNYAKARIAFAAGENKRALEATDAVFSVMPRHLPSLYLAANINFREGNLATAASQLEMFLSEQPRNHAARRMLAAVELGRGEAGQAVEIARQLLQESPMNPQTMNILALALSAQGEHADSAEIYQRQVGLEPESAEVRIALGTEWLRAGEVGEAIAELQRARELAPANEQARTRLAQAHMMAEDNPAALREVEDFRAVAPESPVPSLLLAKMTQLEGDANSASEYFREALELDPSSRVARQGLVDLALQRDDTDTALAVYDQGLEVDPDNLSSLLGRAEVQEQRGETADMAQTLRKAVESRPQALEPRLRLARYYLREGKPGESVNLLSEVSDEYRNNAQVQQLLLGAYLALEQPGPAVTAARRLQKLLPDQPVALRLAAQAEGANRDYARAEQLLRRAHELDPDDVNTHKMLIETLMLQNKLEQTSEELAKLPESVASDPQISLARGRIAIQLFRPEEAEALIRRAHEAQPGSNSVVFLSTSLMQQGRGEEAVNLLAEWVEDHPDDIRALERLGVLYVASGQDELARPIYETLSSFAPESVVALNNLAWTLRKSDSERALGLVRDAAELAPDNASVLDTQAMILLEMKDYNAALQAIDSALKTSPDNTQFRFHRARILAEAGQADEAVGILQALVDGPAFPAQGRARELLQILTSS